jgi:hypothetical protein
MSRVFISGATGAGIYIHSHDHCLPHVHAVHRGEGWVVKTEFSFVSNRVEVQTVTPRDKPPLARALNALLSDIQEHLPRCRQTWWEVHQLTGLENRWAMVAAPGMIEMLPAPRPGAKRIIDARYDAATGRLQVVFRDGSRVEISLQP